jgi:hypothetical protein
MNANCIVFKFARQKSWKDNIDALPSLENIVVYILLEVILAPVTKPGIRKWGLRGRYSRGVLPPAGARGCAPGKIFKLQMHAGEF